LLLLTHEIVKDSNFKKFTNPKFVLYFRYQMLILFLFICHGISTRKQRRDLFGLRLKLPLLPV